MVKVNLSSEDAQHNECTAHAFRSQEMNLAALTLVSSEQCELRSESNGAA